MASLNTARLLKQEAAAPASTSAAPALDLAQWWGTPTRKIAANTQPRRWLGQTKMTLPLLGLCLLLLAFLWPAFLPSMPSVQAVLEKLRPGVVEELAMFDLTYRGTNNQGQPFSVEALKATRSHGQDNAADPQIALTAPSADLTTKDGDFVALTADQGLYNEKRDALQLQGNVEIIHDNGAVFNAPALQVDFVQNRAESVKPVTVHGAFGEISAAGMVLEDGGDRVIFKGAAGAPARALINSAPRAALSDATPDVAPDAASDALDVAEPQVPPQLP